MCFKVGYTHVVWLTSTHVFYGWLHTCFKVGYTCV